jgi:hypothetical protein
VNLENYISHDKYYSRFTTPRQIPQFIAALISKALTVIMVQKEEVKTDKAPPPLPFFSQAIKCQGMVYCSGSIGMDPISNKMVEGTVGDRTVCLSIENRLTLPTYSQL